MYQFSGKRTIKEILQDDIVADMAIDDKHSLLIYGENLTVLRNLLEAKQGKIDLVYIDPPFNTNQVFAVSNGRANTISRAKNGTVAYSDLLSKEEFFVFIYERFALLHQFLSDEGSLYVHIDNKMGHYFKVILDEIFGEANFKNDITRVKSNPKNFSKKSYGNQKDMILFYAKNANKNIWNDIRFPIDNDDKVKKRFSKIDENGRRYTTIPLHAPGETFGVTGQPWRGMNPPEGRHWRTNPTEFDKMDELGLIEWSSTGNPRIKKYADEHIGEKIQDIWTFKDPQNPVYPTEKNLEMVSLIVQQSSREGGFVLDCFSGSGTTLLASAVNNRRFIGIDNSEIAIKVSKEKLSGHEYAYYDLMT